MAASIDWRSIRQGFVLTNSRKIFWSKLVEFVTAQKDARAGIAIIQYGIEQAFKTT